MDLNYKMILKIIGIILCVLGFAMTLPVLIAVIYDEPSSMNSFLYTLIPTIICGAIFILIGKSNKKTFFRIRESNLLASMSWLLCAIISCIPLVTSGSIPSIIDAFFETCSGFSTTGATVIKNVEALPHAILFWRTFMHWLGGMGILVFTVALLPTLGISAQQMSMAEGGGPTLSKITPKISDTARYLYIFYTLLTLVEASLLMIGDVSFFDAITHSFSTMGTGGFANYNDSIAHFDSAYIDIVITVFMIIAATNFNLYFIVLKQGLKTFYKDSEFKLYMFLVFGIGSILSISLFANGIYDLKHSFVHGIFQNVSILSTTGFSTVNYELWPTFCQMLLFLLFFTGGCTSSTTGGIKVYRVVVLLKTIKRSIAVKIHPHTQVKIRVNNKNLNNTTVSNIVSFLFLYILCGMIGAFIISFDDCSFITSLSASFSCLGGIGPGFDHLGPAYVMGDFSGLSKFVLSILMIAGRLEVFTFFMILTKRFWNPFK